MTFDIIIAFSCTNLFRASYKGKRIIPTLFVFVFGIISLIPWPTRYTVN